MIHYKTELIADRVWRSRAQLELATVQWVAWFNHDRLHERSGERPSENATWGKSGRQWGEMMAVVGENRGRRRPSAVSQAVLMVQWLWSLSRLCVAVTNRHSDKAADRPLRMKRSMCRLYLIWPNTGSIVIFRWA